MKRRMKKDEDSDSPGNENDSMKVIDKQDR
jgi:hypothetical protein